MDIKKQCRGGLSPVQVKKNIRITFFILFFYIGITSICSNGSRGFLSAADSSGKQGDAVKSVLYVNSYHPGYRWSDQVQAGISDTLSRGLGPGVDLRIEYLDGKRFSADLKGSLGYEVASTWRKKYGSTKLDLIIVSDQDAYDFIKRFRHELFPGVPVVFCGVEDPGVIEDNTTGVIRGNNDNENIELILRLIPYTKRIWFATDRSAAGLSNRRRIERLAVGFSSRVDLVFFDREKAMEPDEIFSVAEKLGHHDVIFYLDYCYTRSGKYIDVGNFLNVLTSRSAVPVFSHVEMYLEYGVTGGKMNSGYYQGRQSAETALRILSGTDIKSMPPALEESHPFFNYQQLKKFSIHEQLLPPDSIVINREDSFIYHYIWYLAGALLLFMLQSVFIIRMFILVRKQKQLTDESLRKENALARSEKKYRTLSESASMGIWHINADEETEYVNNAMCRMLEIDSIDELQGEKFRRFFTPESLETIRLELEKRTRGESSIYEAVIRGRMGRLRNVLVSGAPLMDIDNRFIGRIATVADITELKHAEEELKSWINRYNLIVAASGQAVYEYIVPSGEITWGKSIVNVLGYPEEEMNGGFTQWQNLLHPDDKEKTIKTLTEAEKNCAFWDERYRMLHHNGNYVWIRDRGFFIPDESGRAYSQLGLMEDITSIKESEEALKESEERNRAILNAIPDMIFVFNREGVFTDFRSSDLTRLIITPEIFMGKSIFEVLPDDLARLTHENIMAALDTGITQIYKYSTESGNLSQHFESRMVVKGRGEVLAIVRDITDRIRSEEERERLQAQLTQAQKLESIGRLAGGIAHDFNNMLGAITGYSELALRKMDEGDPLRRYLDEILKAAVRSSDLTRQLLAFARQQVIEPKVISLNDTVEGMLPMLRRLIGENINLVWKPSADLWRVNVDPAQMDQVLANLSINAKDAISESGTITIETMNMEIDEAYSSETDSIQPGSYAVLVVSDTGCGMTRGTLERIFEPFFTTKELGHGTGLGLATVFGIVKQNSGFINVYSEPGEGSAFRIYIPGIRDKGVASEQISAIEFPYGRGETVLLAEDDPALLDITRALIEELNYSVLAADTPDLAISYAEGYDGDIRLLVTDIIMPQMNGHELSDRIAAIRPGIKLLFMSGYTADVIARHGIIHEGISFIQKPFSLRDIAFKIKEALEKE